MGAAGHGSNRDLLREMAKVRARIGRLGPAMGPPRPFTQRSRRPMGEVAVAITQILENGAELATGEIQLAIERLLGDTVHPSTVKNCLARSAERADGRFQRVSRGRYRLVDAPTNQSRSSQ